MDRVWLWVEERGSKSWWWNGGGGGRILMCEEPKGWLTRTCFLEDRDIGHEKDRVFTAGGGGRGWRWWFVGGSSGGACRAGWWSAWEETVLEPGVFWEAEERPEQW